MDDGPQYRRILIKLSGEWLMGDSSYGIEPGMVKILAGQIKKINDNGVETGVVIGGGNIFRGLKASQAGMDRVTADHMGMLATVINSLALQDQLIKNGMPARVMTAVDMPAFADTYTQRQARQLLADKTIVIMAAGTGWPFFTTDTAAALRAAETGAQLLIKGTRVDGVYSSDPEIDSKAEFFPELTFDEVLARDLKVMDATAITLCRDNKIPIRVINLNIEDNLYRAARGESLGTLVQ